MLFWLGDQSDDNSDTWAFLDRRLANVTAFEKTKAAINNNPIAKALLAGPLKLLEKIRAPQLHDLPGQTKQ